MNEQLIVKNFGPIKDATVDFKRVTVFIGPTGGGKSTLAKLAAVFRDDTFFVRRSLSERQNFIGEALSSYGISNFRSATTELYWESVWLKCRIMNGAFHSDEIKRTSLENDALSNFQKLAIEHNLPKPSIDEAFGNKFIKILMNSPNANEIQTSYFKLINSYFPEPLYVPADRLLAAFVTGSAFRLQSQKVGISSILIDFLGRFEAARDSFAERGGYHANIPFLELHYNYLDGQQIVKQDTPQGLITTLLSESASGIQSAIPIILVAEFYGAVESIRNGFIIEEPELNLYPTAQQGLLNWLVEKCTKGENDLTITTHSPYILSHLNLLLYAYQVAEKHPDRREAVAAIVPEASWINPQEFACYQVENGGVTSLVDEDLGLIDDNGLDNLSGDAADAFDNLIRLSKGFARK